MRFTTAIVTAILAFQVAAAPVPQLAGEGQACDSILTQTDNGVGYGIENAEDKIAGNISGATRRHRRQLAGEGSLCNSVFTQTDNGVGYGIENAEDNIAKNLGGTGSGGGAGSGSGSGGAPPPPPPPPPKGPKSRRQLDKISNGFQGIANAAKVGDSTSALTNELDSLDGTLTGGAADAGKQIGDTEASTLEGAGLAIPKRQLDKISNGFQGIANAAKVGSSTSAVTGELDSLDGTLTGGAADAGRQIGDTEASTLEGAGSAVP